MRANVFYVVGLIQGVVVTGHLFDTASGRPDDVVVLLEDVDKQAFRRGRICLVAAIGHRLPTAGLIERILYVESEPFQEF